MKTNSFLKTALHPFCLIAFMVILAFTSCQKDSLGELTTSGLDAPDAQSSLALEKLILEINFQMPTDEMTNDQILQLYTEMMGYLSIEIRTRLIDMGQKALDQENVYHQSHSISTRSTESVLSTGILNDDFGSSVETAGNKVYVGARLLQKVFEYAKTGGSYELINEITPDQASRNFGSVSVSGSWMAVGAPATAALGGGKVFMYKKQGGAWVQQAVLTGPAGNNNFGPQRGVGLEGNTLMVTSTIPGVPQTLTTIISVFTLSGNEWSLEQELVQPGISHSTVRLDASGDRIATASGQGNAFSLPRSFIYVRNGSGWTLEDEVIIDLPGVGAATEVAINGNTLVMMPVFPSDNTLLLVITNNGGDWTLSQQQDIPVGQLFSRRNAQIEGQKLIIGSTSTNNAIPDEVYVFENFGASWDLTETLTPSDLGVNVAITSLALEGNTIVAGCWNIGSSFGGKAYVFE